MVVRWRQTLHLGTWQWRPTFAPHTYRQRIPQYISSEGKLNPAALVLETSRRTGMGEVRQHPPLLFPKDVKNHTSGVSEAGAIHELPATEVIHELPAAEVVYELPSTEAETAGPKFWMADEDWADTEPRGPESIYMSLTCGDKVQVLEMPPDDLHGSVWRVVRPSDGREGWVPSQCLRPLEDVTPRRQKFDASPIEGVFW